jgi:hypothetical protein
MPTPVGSSNNIAEDAHFTCDTKPRAVRNAKTTHPDGDFAQPDHTDDVAEPSPPPASLRTTSVVRALPTIPHGQARTALASKLRAVSVAAESTPEPAPVQVPSTSASKVKPGAVSVATASVPEPVPVRVPDASVSNVKTRTAPASKPGAVSVAAESTPEPVPVRVPDASLSNVKTRTVPAFKPGAVSVAAESTPEPAPVQVPSTSASKVKTRTAPASKPGAVSVATASVPEPVPVRVPDASASNVKTRTTPASKPGAVCVAAESTPEPVPVRVPDASSSNVKTRTAPASKPGAVSVAAENTPEPEPEPVQLPNASACNAKARTVPVFKPGAVNATAAKRPAVPSASTSEIKSSKTPTFKPGTVSITTASVPEPAPVQMPNVSASDFDTRTAPAFKPRTVSVINADAAKSSNIVVATMEGSSIANKPSDRESAKGRALNPGASAATAKSHFATKGFLCSVPPSNDSLRATADFSAGKNIAKNTAVSGHAVEKNLAFREATIQRNTHSLSGQDALVVANASDDPVSEVQAVEPGHTKSVANQTMKSMQTKLEEMEVQHLNYRSAHEDGNSKNDKGESSPFSEAGLSAMHHSHNLRHLTELFPVETKGDRGIANSPDGMSGLAATGDENLAIAIAVEDVEEKGTLVAAFEYDPDAKPTIFKNRRFQMYTILGCLFAIGAIVTGVIVSTTNAGEDETVFVTLSPTITPTMAPTTLIFNELRNEFAKQIGPQALSSEESYESVAKWITEEDPLQVTPDDSNFLQRYILALFWFQTTNNGMDPWLSCNRPVGEEDETCMFLNFTTIDDNFEIAYKEESAVRWLSGTNECRWPGIFCHEGSVVSIRLAGCSLNGPIPVELQFLNVLNYLGLHYNLLTGVIPSEVAGLKNLIALELQGMERKGDIIESQSIFY